MKQTIENTENTEFQTLKNTENTENTEKMISEQWYKQCKAMKQWIQTMKQWILNNETMNLER